MNINFNEEKANQGITKELELVLLDILTDHKNDAYHPTELAKLAKEKMSDKYKNVDMTGHITYALDMLHSNHMVKRVGSNIWQSIDGPDPVYSDRVTGYAPEGEYVKRGKNFLGNMSGTERKKFNTDLSSAETSVKMLKRAGMTQQQQVYDAIIKSENGTKFNPVAVKVAIKRIFSLPGLTTPTTDPIDDIDPSIFGNDIDIVK